LQPEGQCCASEPFWQVLTLLPGISHWNSQAEPTAEVPLHEATTVCRATVVAAACASV
jgi:hypothetical protein